MFEGDFAGIYAGGARGVLAVRNGVKLCGISRAGISRATATEAWIATGAAGAGAEAWPIWQTWQRTSSEAFACWCVRALVASRTTAIAIVTANSRWRNFLFDISGFLVIAPR